MDQQPSSIQDHDKALKLERRRQVRGSLLLARAVLTLAILRAGLHRVFGVGWWRLW